MNVSQLILVLVRLGFRLVMPVSGALALGGLVACAAPVDTRPSAVLVLDIDTLRADRLGAYGNPRSPSPHIDALAEASTVFEWAIASAPYTPPSQASIFTGLHPHHHGVWTRHERLGPVPTLAGELARAGWRTVGLTDGGYLSAGFGLGQGFDVFDDRGGGLEPLFERARSELAATGPDQRLLMLIHTYHVHTPYEPGPEARGWALEGGVAPATPGFEPSSEVMEDVRRNSWVEPGVTLPEGDLDYARALYDAEIREMDQWVGEVLALFRARWRPSELIVVLLSDHGEAFGEHGSVLHETLYLPVVRVPLVIQASQLPRGRVREAVQLVDVMPTLLDLAGVGSAHLQLDGRSLTAAAHGEARQSLALSQSGYFRDKPALLVGDWHLVRNRRTGDPELYRYRDDPLETADLASLEGAATSRLNAALERATRPRFVPASHESDVPAEVLDQLKALGYVR